MPLLRPTPRLLLRPVQRCAYSSAQAPALNVTNVPAPHSGSIRILSLNRPAARNAISRQLLAELNHQVNSIHNEGEKGSTRALILASDVDTSFCAGADLKERATFTQEEYARITTTMNTANEVFQHSKLPHNPSRHLLFNLTTTHTHNLRARRARIWRRPRTCTHNTHARLRIHHDRRTPRDTVSNHTRRRRNIPSARTHRPVARTRHDSHRAKSRRARSIFPRAVRSVSGDHARRGRAGGCSAQEGAE